MIVGTNRDRATGSSASVFGTAFTVLLTGLSFVATSRHLDRAMDLSWWLTLGVLGVIALSTHLIVAGGRGWRSVLVARIVVVLCAGGIGTQVVLGSTGRGLMMAVWLAVGIAVGDVVGRVLVRIPRPHWVWWIGGVTLAAFLMRLAPAVGGLSGFRQGSIGGIKVTEFARLGFFVAAALFATKSSVAGAAMAGMRTASGRWSRPITQGILVVGAAVFLLLAGVFVGAGDIGPLAIVIFALMVMLYRVHGSPIRRPLLAVGIAGAAFTLVLDRDETGGFKVVGRVRDLLEACPEGASPSQLCLAQRSMSFTGMIGNGPGSAALAFAVPAYRSDYIPATVVAFWGYGAIIGLLAVSLLIPYLLAKEAARRKDLPGIAVTGAAAMLLLPMFWSPLANFAILPISGIDMPFVSANGAVLLVSVALVSMSIALLSSSASDVVYGHDSYGGFASGPEREVHNGREVRKMVGAVAVMSLAVLMITTVVKWVDPQSRVYGESNYRNRGAIVTSDGQVFASPSYSGGLRNYSNGRLVADLGFFSPFQKVGQGLEFSVSGAATCGQTHVLPWKPECGRTTVVSSLHMGLQQRMYRSLDETTALAGLSATIVVMDAESGQIRSVASKESGSTPSAPVSIGSMGPDLNSGAYEVGPTGRIITDGDPIAFDASVKRLADSKVEDAAESGSPDLGRLRERAAFVSSRQLENVFVRAPEQARASAGSVFKIVTGTVAALDGIEPVEPLPSPWVIPVPGAEPAVMPNAWDGPCQGQRVQDMLSQSCNTVAAWMAVQAGAERMNEVAAYFGVTSDIDPLRSGRGDSNPLSGLVGPADPTRPEVDLYSFPDSPSTSGLSANADAPALARAGFGQEGVRLSPVTVAGIGATVASRGGGGRPTLVHGWCEGSSLTDWSSPRRPEPAFDGAERFGEALDVAYEGMRGAVAHGTATRLAGVLPAHELAAKTGTAEVESTDLVPASEDSWMVVIVDRSTVVALAVQHSAENRFPGDGIATEVLAGWLPGIMEELEGGRPSDNVCRTDVDG